MILPDNSIAQSISDNLAVNAANAVNGNIDDSAESLEDIAKALESINKATGSSFRPIRPLKQQDSNLPEFPVSCLPNVIRAYVLAEAAHSQTSPDMAAVIALGVLATCLQGKYAVESAPGYAEQLSLYIAVIASSGERKSSVLKDMAQCLDDYEREYNARLVPEITARARERDLLELKIDSLRKQLRRAYDYDMADELSSMTAELAALPVITPARYVTDDCTPEALIRLLAANGGVMSVISAEGGIFDILGGRYASKPNLDPWLKGHSGDTIRVDRISRPPEYIPRPALSAILTMQPSVMADILANRTMAGRGLIARFLYAVPTSTIGSRKFASSEIPADISAAYRNLVYRLMDIPRPDELTVITLSAEAVEVISEHFAANERYLVAEGQAIADWAAKYIGAVCRLAGLLLIADNGGASLVITGGIMRNAISIGTYFREHAAYAYTLMGDDLSMAKARYVWGCIQKAKISSIKRWELVKACRGALIKDKDDLQPALDVLQDYGYIRIMEPEATNRAGRKSDVIIEVNPRALASET